MSSERAIVTIESVEQCLDSLAKMIIRHPDDAPKMLIIYERLERDLAEMKASQAQRSALMSSVLNRIKRSSDQTAAQF